MWKLICYKQVEGESSFIFYMIKYLLQVFLSVDTLN